MSNILTATVVRYGTQLVESYKRKTKVATDELIAQGLDPNREYQSVVGIASIPEYIVFQTANIVKNQPKTFKTQRYGADLNFKSLYIDFPETGELYIEIYDETANLILSQKFEKNKTPIDFSVNPLRSGLTIKIRALQDIKFVRLTATPCKILETFYAEEDYPAS